MRINYSALTRPITNAEVAAYKKMIKYNFLHTRVSDVGTLQVLIILFLFLVVLPATFVVDTAILTVLMGLNVSVAGIVAFIRSALLILVIGWLIGMPSERRALIKRTRRNLFIAENNFTFNAPGKHVREGFLFGLDDVSSLVTSDTISTKGENSPFEIGNCWFRVRYDRISQDHKWGYISIALERDMPNIVLDAKSNNSVLSRLGASNLPVRLKKDQVLSLEGNFDQYFTLYAPKEYEHDALYVFTPDLMALLIDNVADFDVEVVKDRIYVYSSKQFDLSDKATMERLFHIIDVIGAKMNLRTRLYADEQETVQTLSASKQLRQGIRPITVIAWAFAALYVLVPLLLLYTR